MYAFECGNVCFSGWVNLRVNTGKHGGYLWLFGSTVRSVCVGWLVVKTEVDFAAVYLQKLLARRSNMALPWCLPLFILQIRLDNWTKCRYKQLPASGAGHWRWFMPSNQKMLFFWGHPKTISQYLPICYSIVSTADALRCVYLACFFGE